MKKIAFLGVVACLLIILGALAWRHSHHISDATIEQLAVGTWQPVMPPASHVEKTTDMKPDGSFSTKVMTYRTGVTNWLAYTGSWEVKNGYITLQITNVTEGDKTWLPSGDERFRVVQIDSKQMVMQQDGTRNLSRMDRR